MGRTQFARFAAVASLALAASAALAQPLGVNLVVNGDAETGDITGWIDGGIESKETGPVGTLGVPTGVDIGEYCFTGGQGSEAETLTQTIDVSGLAAAIDAGDVTAAFSILIQSRRVVGGHDRGIATLEYREDSGAALATAQFEDIAVVDVHDWSLFEDERTVPAGTRTVRIRLLATRDVGASTEGFFDNVSLVLSGACPADLDGDGVLTIFDFLAFQNLFDSGDPGADFDGDGSLTIFDFLAFQNAFDAGC